MPRMSQGSRWIHANQPVLPEIQAVAMPLSSGSMRRPAAANGSASFSSASGNSSAHQNSVLAISRVQLRMPVTKAKRPRGTGARRRGGTAGAAERGWLASAESEAAEEAGEEEGNVVMGASLRAVKELELALDQRGRWLVGISS
ncbi:hypothetical protein CBM2608_A110084 [Cupriavidus taiwanensis]|nr:hypothetical protein CBM2608_A110084 [Cupriavidus taiwanensis]